MTWRMWLIVILSAIGIFVIAQTETGRLVLVLLITGGNGS